MSRRRPERMPVQVRFHASKTVRLMIEDQWSVVSRCQSCGLQLHVPLKAVARLLGPDVSLWNRKARCQKVFCNGSVEYLGKAIDMQGYEVLPIDPKVPL